MKKIILFFCSLLMCACFISCAKDIVDVNGNITGIIKDYDDAHLISNCQVTLRPGGNTALTGSDGQFSFSGLEPGSYTLAFSKSGYEDQSKTVTVTSGQTTDASLTMKSKGAFVLSETTLNFGDLSGNMSFSITNNSDTNCSFEISNIPSWASFSQTSGVVTSGNTTSVTVTVDRSKVEYGTFTQNVQISYKGTKQGSVTVTLNMSRVKLTTPEVQISSSAQDITQNSFVIGGQITATGGSQISDYGHCWSLSPNPSINDQHSSNGATQSVGEFTTTVSNLTAGTTYYVRAYATNAQGTSYSSQVIVSTQDVASNKWDGNIATSFAGGNGTAGSPYKIETGGQLLLMKEYVDKCFVLAGNIDLNNNNWLPFEFRGTLDGAGYTISNLYINRTDDKQGLFSELGQYTNIQNLNIKGVKIECNNSYVGALAGYVYRSYGVTINNVNVILTQGSVISGQDVIGGLLGYFNARSNSTLNDCHVSSSSSDYVICGNDWVGGILGNLVNEDLAPHTMNQCTADVSIKAGSYVGGIAGSLSSRNAISNCYFNGKIDAKNYAGGIAGRETGSSSKCQIIGCKANTDISCQQYAGGILGATSGGDYVHVVACYTIGSIKANSCDGIFGSNSYGGNAFLCYTTMACGLSNNCQDCATTASAGGGTNTVVNCIDITSHLKSAYSNYAQYYNFNSTWTWTGTVNGKTVSVSCPKLSWESENSSSKR